MNAAGRADKAFGDDAGLPYVADLRALINAVAMRCFYVLVHGQLNWRPESTCIDDELGDFRPDGFYCHRYVLASNEVEARETAFRRVRENLEKQTGWMSTELATVDLEAERLTVAPMIKLLKPDNRGHTFYSEE